jgi:ketosteroid isomerase-like protein
MADTPAGELPAETATWCASLVDEELLAAIMNYYAEDCRLYDLTAVQPAGSVPV